MSIYYTKLTVFVKQKFKICHLKETNTSKNLTGSRWHWDTELLAFSFLCKNPAVFVNENPRIFLWLSAKNFKRQPASPACSAHQIFDFMTS